MAHAAHIAETHILEGSSRPTGEAPAFEPVVTAEAEGTGLLQLIKQPDDILPLLDAAAEVSDRAYDVYYKARPERPAALYWKGLDDPGSIPRQYVDLPNGRYRAYYGEFEILDLREGETPCVYAYKSGVKAKSIDGSGFA